MMDKINKRVIAYAVGVGAIILFLLSWWTIHLKATSYSPTTLRTLSEKEQIQLYTFEKCGSLKLYKQASFIIQHESQWNPQAIGDKGDSVGLWQISMKWNKDITKQEALDWKWATDWSVDQLKKGKANLWSSWKYRTK